MAMGRPRGEVIREDEVGVYHVWNCCVRGAFLCGLDPRTGKNYDHRKRWIFDRIKELAETFSIDACVFAIMSSHYHLIVRNRIDLAREWSDEEVVRRWWRLFPERRDDNGDPAEPKPIEIKSMLADKKQVAEWRRRLSSISWFMKCLDESIAKRCNSEDGVRGHFWADRFSARSLTDTCAILACSIYVDLNEIRARLAETPEDSRNTSAYHRILGQLRRREREEADGISPAICTPNEEDPDYWLCPIHEQDQLPLLGPPGVPSVADSVACLAEPTNPAAARKRWRHGILPVTVDEYLELLDTTGRIVVAGKSGAIDADLPPILERLRLQPSSWIAMVHHVGHLFQRTVGKGTPQ